MEAWNLDRARVIFKDAILQALIHRIFPRNKRGL